MSPNKNSSVEDRQLPQFVSTVQVSKVIGSKTR